MPKDPWVGQKVRATKGPPEMQAGAVAREGAAPEQRRFAGPRLVPRTSDWGPSGRRRPSVCAETARQPFLSHQTDLQFISCSLSVASCAALRAYDPLTCVASKMKWLEEGGAPRSPRPLQVEAAAAHHPRLLRCRTCRLRSTCPDEAGLGAKKAHLTPRTCLVQTERYPSTSRFWELHD